MKLLQSEKGPELSARVADKTYKTLAAVGTCHLPRTTITTLTRPVMIFHTNQVLE